MDGSSTNESENWRFSRKKFLRRAAMPKRITDGQLRSGLNVAISCTDTVMIGGETFAYFCTFVKNSKNGHIRPVFSERARPISTIHVYSALIDMWVRMINLMFVLRSLKGRCYGNQLIWDTFYKHRIDRIQSLL